MSTDHPDTLAVTLRWLDGTSEETVATLDGTDRHGHHHYVITTNRHLLDMDTMTGDQIPARSSLTIRRTIGMTTPGITDFLRARYAHERVIGDIVARSSLGPTSLILRDLDAKLAIVTDMDRYCWNRRVPRGACGTCDRIGCRTLRKLARPFSDHDDYDPTWTDPNPKD